MVQTNHLYLAGRKQWVQLSFVDEAVAPHQRRGAWWWGQGWSGCRAAAPCKAPECLRTTPHCSTDLTQRCHQAPSPPGIEDKPMWQTSPPHHEPRFRWPCCLIHCAGCTTLWPPSSDTVHHFPMMQTMLCLHATDLSTRTLLCTAGKLEEPHWSQYPSWSCVKSSLPHFTGEKREARGVSVLIICSA